jgi:ABC-type transporter Mla maintaining outer membrane lipid asymmetry ATPase subunit MlaF
MSAPASRQALLELRAVRVAGTADAGTAVLEAVDWIVGRGDVWVVGGLPGTGKSQLLMAAAGLLPLVGGQVLWQGRDLAAMNSSELTDLRRRLGFVFADGGRLFDHLTVAQNVGLPLTYHRNRGWDAVADEVARLLETLALGAVADARPGQLTRNLRQRAALARALALQPEVLFLDNPLAGLDARERRWIVGFLERLRHPDTPGPGLRAVVAATDDLRPWLRLATATAVIRDRRFHPLGPPGEARNCRDRVFLELLAEGGDGE